MSKKAGVANSGNSHTKMYTTYRIQKDGQDTFYPLGLNDSMGQTQKSLRERCQTGDEGTCERRLHVSQMSPKAIETLQDIREEASDLNIPQVAILTKIDLICPEIKKDVKNVYRSKILKQKLQQGTPNFPFPGHINQLRLGDPEAFPGQVRDIIPPPSPGSPRGLLPAGRPST
ncbi:uncharacterized protein LOC144533791 isoform X2 [Sander vitreus]